MFRNDNIEFIKSLKDNPYYKYFGVDESVEKMSEEELAAYRQEQAVFTRKHVVKYENPYVNINCFEKRYIDMFDKEDDITVQEKIDGSNAHMIVDGAGVTCYSNNCILNECNNLQGFYFWCGEHYRQVPEKYFSLSIYGEWLVPHHCRYPVNAYGNFYVFDVMENGKYWEQSNVEKLAQECGFTYVPTFYTGKFQSWKHLMTYVGKTALGGEKGEGIVVKNNSTLNKGRISYIKIVDVEFQETNISRDVIKTVDMDEVIRTEHFHELVEGIITEARVRKLILKNVDHNLLPVTWSNLSGESICKVIRSDVIRDCIKEEKDVVDLIGSKRFGYFATKRIGSVIKQLQEKS